MFTPALAPSLDHAPRLAAQHAPRSSQTTRRRLCWALIALLCACLSAPAPSAFTASAATRNASAPARTTHVHLYGYLEDRFPATDNELLIHNKTHNKDYYVTPMGSTVFKKHGLVIPRRILIKGMYVIATCVHAGATLDALTVSVVVRRPRKKAH